MPDTIMRFRFEPTTEGFFSMLEALSRREGAIDSIEPDRADAEADLFDDFTFIRANRAKAEALRGRLAKTGGRTVEELEAAFLSGRTVWREAVGYCRFALSGETAKLDDETDPDVRAVKAAWRATVKEIHRFEGILRFFPRSDGAYVSVFDPDADILERLLPFFASRFGETPFLLIDERRKKCGGTATPDGRKAAESENDEDEGLWKAFYRATENPARFNPELRRRFIPYRYWKNLVEMEGELR